jgi:hypothetical protein
MHASILLSLVNSRVIAPEAFNSVQVALLGCILVQIASIWCNYPFKFTSLTSLRSKRKIKAVYLVNLSIIFIELEAHFEKEEQAAIAESRKSAAALARDEIRLKHDQEKIVLQILAMNKEPMVPAKQVRLVKYVAYALSE